MNITQIRNRGQVTIPKKIRLEAGVDEGANVIIFTEPGRIILKQVGITPFPTREYTDQEIKQFIKDDQLSDELKKKVDKLLVK